MSKRTTLALASLLFIVAFAGCRRFRFPAQPANYREYAYVTSGENGTVSVLDLVQMRQDRVLQVGTNPTGAAANPFTNEVYVVNAGAPGHNGSLSVIHTIPNEIIATVPLHDRPYQISIDAQGRRGYIANAGSNTVSIVDLVSHREIATVGTGEEPGLAKISPDGRTLIVSNRKAGSISIYGISDAPEPHLRATFANCTGATDVAVIPLDSKQPSTKAFVACSGSESVLAVSLAQPPDTWAARQDSTLTRDHVLSRLCVGNTPIQLAVKPDGGEIFVSNFRSGTISEISTSTNEVGGTYRIGMQPSHALIGRDNATLWVANFGGESLSLYSIDDGRIAGSVRTGAAPDVLAMSADEHLLLAANAKSGDVAVIRTRDRNGPELFTLLPAGAKPNGIAIKAFTIRH